MRLARMALGALAVLGIASAVVSLTVLNRRELAYAAFGSAAVFVLLLVVAGARRQRGPQVEIALPARPSRWERRPRRRRETPSREPELLDWPRKLETGGTQWTARHRDQPGHGTQSGHRGPRLPDGS